MENQKPWPWKAESLFAACAAVVTHRQTTNPRQPVHADDIIDTIGRRVYELVLPFPKDKEQEAVIINKVQEVFAKRTEAKNLMRNVLLNVTPVHDYDDDSSFMTLV